MQCWGVPKEGLGPQMRWINVLLGRAANFQGHQTFHTILSNFRQRLLKCCKLQRVQSDPFITRWMPKVERVCCVGEGACRV